MTLERGGRRAEPPAGRDVPRRRRRTPARVRPAEQLQTDPALHDRLLFNEYFHGDTGAGLGASHQTGWTGLVADLIAMPRVGRDGRRRHVGRDDERANDRS